MSSSKALHACEHVFNVVVAILLLGGALFAGYSLWDNQQVYAKASDVMNNLLSMRPQEGGDNGPTFDELRAINPDVCAWITLEGTQIDYPVVQGEDDLEYLNKDVYGDFALSGSIFLSSLCSNDFSDAYSLIYGHHMANDLMFGDLDFYKDESFFGQHNTGVLMTPDTTYGLQIFAVMTVNASDDTIFSPTSWKYDCSGVVSYAASNADLLNQDVVDEIGASGENERIVSLATCSSDSTEARTVVLARIVPYTGQ